MPEERTDNLETAPQGTTEPQAGEETTDYSALSFEDLEKAAEKGELQEAPKQEAQQEAQQEPESKQESALPDDLKGKSAEELAQMYANLRKMQGEQSNELGELRKYRKEQDELQEQLKNSQTSATAQRLIQREIKGMTSEERSKFYDRFAEDPEGALSPLISKTLEPFLHIVAKQNNESEIRRLKESTKDSLVPYDEAAINRIIAAHNRDGRNELFDQYGSGAFEKAYQEYYRTQAETAFTRKLQEMTDRVKAEEEPQAKTYTESPGVSRGPGEPNYAEMSWEQLRKAAGDTDDE